MRRYYRDPSRRLGGEEIEDRTEAFIDGMWYTIARNRRKVIALNYSRAICAVIFSSLRATVFAGSCIVYEVESTGRMQFAGIQDPDVWYATNAGILEIPAHVDGCPVVYVKGRACFSNQKIRRINLGDSLQSVGNSAFQSCSNLTEICFASNQERRVSISPFAFANNVNLCNVKFPSSLVLIGSGAFMGCDKLVDVVFPRGLVTVSAEAFACCGSLERVSIPATVEMMDDAFSIFTPNLRVVDLSAENPYYFKEEDALYSRERHELVLYPRVTTNKIAKIKNGTEWVRGFAFFQCKGIETVEFPITVQVICDGAFGCSTLKSVVFPDHLDAIGDKAFAECTNLEEVTFRSRVKHIGEDAFGGCLALKRVAAYAEPFDAEFDKYFPSNAVFSIHGYYKEWGQYSIKTGRRVEMVKESKRLSGFKSTLQNQCP